MPQEIIRSLFSLFERNELNPILVGGWAVSYHGYPRTTLDIDFLLCSDKKTELTSLLEPLGYSPSSSGTMVTRYAFKDPWYPMLDILWVDPDTYQEMYSHSEEPPHSPVTRVISLQDLIAMKLHAMHNHEERDGKDLLDIRTLLRYNKGVISDPELKKLCSKYGPDNAYAMITSPSA
ncbi:MAG: nucleotidyl transferase AbiEii/AbiGii toxin family protein [Akkermansiaceae bacterium]|nr:nucleotidyl transferase AbiEii/AbiGii toxin family protein [Akkermansiaceae bacterium]